MTQKYVKNCKKIELKNAKSKITCTIVIRHIRVGKLYSAFSVVCTLRSRAMVDLSSGCSARGSAYLTYPSPSLPVLLALTLSLTLVGVVGESQTSTSSSEELQFPEAYESPADALQGVVSLPRRGLSYSY